MRLFGSLMKAYAPTGSLEIMIAPATSVDTSNWCACARKVKSKFVGEGVAWPGAWYGRCSKQRLAGGFGAYDRVRAAVSYDGS